MIADLLENGINSAGGATLIVSVVIALLIICIFSAKLKEDK